MAEIQVATQPSTADAHQPADRVSDSTAAEVQASTLDAFIQGWKEWTLEAFVATWSEDCTQTALPFHSGHPARGRAELEPLFAKMMPLLTDYQASCQVHLLLSH